jgi:DNA-binding transcriptional LysR family regulator
MAPIAHIDRTNLASLDLNLLVALEALLDDASVTVAARRVGLSQPAMSHALRRLRELLQDPLLVRAAGRMQLTERGERLRHPVRDALERVRDLLSTERFDPAQSTRTFRLHVADNACDLLLPPLVERLRSAAPHVRVELRALGERVPDAAELARAFDAAVACVPERFPGFYRQRLFTDRDVCALRTGHALARRTLDRDRFLAARHVAVVVPGAREDPVDTWLRGTGRPRNVALAVPHYLQALHVVARSDLVAVIPERLVRAYARALGLRTMRMPLDAGTFDEYLLHPARTHSDPGSAWFRGVVKEIGDGLP